ncbi:hypothetical protein [uncultured Anaerococcus sp.]|nr:hypothetical protein [uncultured Anaerococcus sp.]
MRRLTKAFLAKSKLLDERLTLSSFLWILPKEKDLARREVPYLLGRLYRL